MRNETVRDFVPIQEAKHNSWTSFISTNSEPIFHEFLSTRYSHFHEFFFLESFVCKCWETCVLLLANNLGISNWRPRCLSTLFSKRNKKQHKVKAVWKNTLNHGWRKLQKMKYERGWWKPMNLLVNYIEFSSEYWAGEGRKQVASLQHSLWWTYYELFPWNVKFH